MFHSYDITNTLRAAAADQSICAIKNDLAADTVPDVSILRPELSVFPSSTGTVSALERTRS